MPSPIPIAKKTVKRALERAEHYRLLNEPAQAESICRDIVAVDPGNEQAWIYLLLSATDQFSESLSHALEHANEALQHIDDEYHKAYYQGIIHERWGRANLQQKRGIQAIQGWISQAMQCYQTAMELAPEDDPDPKLRWNTCARLQEKISKMAPEVRPMAKRDLGSEYEEVPRRGTTHDF